jgi:N-acetylglucosaminyl-diphospho-decaprenol L-rhamnosyltransferase
LAELDLAVIFVTWNVRSLVLDALRTLYDDLAQTTLNACVYVVDNDSADGTVDAIREAFPQTVVLVQAKNLGFAAGNNVALRELGFTNQPSPNSAGPKTVFLLNPDTLVQSGAISALYEALMTQPKAGLVGAQLAYGDGSFQHGAFAFPGLMQLAIDLFPLPARLYESRWNGRYPRQWYAAGKPFPVDFTLGATMMLRREVIEQTGLFDEQFYMYCEEVDWATRIRKAGWQVYTVPTAHITHLEGKSASQIRPQSVINLWTSRLKLYKKHYPPLKFALAKWIVRAGMNRKRRLLSLETGLTYEQREALTNAYTKVLDLYRNGES